MKMKLLIFGGLISAATVAVACCGVSFVGGHVHFAGQSNIIVWDPDTKTEHFIRNAKFETKAKDLGFIAPTPSLPKLEEVDKKAFRTLAKAIDDYQKKTNQPLPAAADASKGVTSTNGVEVVQVAEVAGFTATTLKATDAQGLAEWMKSNGYATTPSIQAWTDFYIKKSWFLTAFKVSVKDGRAETGLVKMSFQTEKPFNPYYVPKDNIPEESLEGLLVYFVGPGEYDAENKQEQFRALLDPTPLYGDFASDFQSELKLTSLPKDATITSFGDYTFPNGKATDDIYFYRIGPQPPIPGATTKTIIGGVIALVVALVAIRLLRRRGQSG